MKRAQPAPPSEVLDAKQAARFLGTDDRGRARISVATLESWRRNGTGPVFVRLGRRVGYLRRDLAAWLEAARQLA